MSIRKILCWLLILVTIFSTVQIANATSYTAYVNKTTYVYQYPRTSAHKVKITKGTEVKVTATSGSWARITKSSNVGYIQTKYLNRKSGGTSSSSWKSKVIKMDWFKEGKNLVKKGSYATLYSIDTRKQFRIKRMGGSSHMDVEPATAADTTTFKSIVKTWNWKSYAMILIANGKYVACGVNAMPHGNQTIKNNNFDGQFCLHMVGSKTHDSNSINAEHQKSINRAYNWAHK